MSWRNNAQRTGMNAQRTGMNAQPLQGARRWGGGGSGEGSGSPPSNYQQSYQPLSYHQQQLQQPPYSSVPSSSSTNPRDAALAAAAAVAASIGIKRDRDGPSASPSSYAPPSSSSTSAPDASEADGGPRKRKSRWGDAPSTTTSTIPTAISSSVKPEDLDKYVIQVRLDEISTKLRTGNFIPPDRERSPSPPPTYDAQGRRTNTREVRYRKKLEDERISLVDRQLKLDPNYRPPADYHTQKRNQRPSEKVYLPIKEFPEINFFGLLVGPRGNTLKTMERQSGAKISIRGKGSVKEGKGKLGGPGDEEEEEMHCVVAADDEAAVKKCIRLINQVIETAASTPEGENDHKRNQLRELAALNGTLRDDENQLCKNCGNKGHRAFECPEQRNWTAHIICHRCGGQGHLARDCTQGRPGGAPPTGPGGPGGVAGGTGNRQFDSEYANLMAELGEPSAAAAAVAAPAGGASLPMNGGASVGADGKKIPPWRNPEVWTQPGFGAPRHGDGAGGGRGGWGGGRGGYGNRGDRGGYGQHHQQQPYGSHSQQTPYHQQQQGQQAYPGYDQAQPAAGAGAGGAGEGQKDYSAEWAAYYAAQAAYTDPTAAAAAGAAGAGQAEVGGVDYTKEWEEYYRMQAAAAAQDGGAAYGGVQGQ